MGDLLREKPVSASFHPFNYDKDRENNQRFGANTQRFVVLTVRTFILFHLYI